MTLAIQVRDYVTPNDTDISNIRTKETLTASQNRLADLLKRLIQVRNTILMGSSSAFINANHAAETSVIIKKTFPPNFNDNNNGSDNDNSPNPFVQSIINSSLEILKNSEIVNLKNLNVSAMLDKVMEINMSGNIGDILKGTDKIMDILNAGLSVESLSEIVPIDIDGVLGELDIESISKGLLSSFNDFSSSFDIIGLLDKSFNNISFSLDPTNINAKIGMFGADITNQFNIGNISNNLMSQFSNSINIPDINGLMSQFSNPFDINNSLSGLNGLNASSLITNGIDKYFNKSTRDLYERSTNITNTITEINLADTTQLNSSVKSLVTDMCEFNTGLKCCTEDIINSYRDGELTDTDIKDLTDILDSTERTIAEIMKSLDFIVYLIDILIDIVKKIIDELIHAISLIKVECYDGKQACLCEVRI